MSSRSLYAKYAPAGQMLASKGLGQRHPSDMLERYYRTNRKGETPTIDTLSNLHKNFIYIVSLEFALGNLDELKQ